MQQLRSAIHNAIARFLKNQPPARIIAVGFALLILLGAALLMLPFAVHPGRTRRPAGRAVYRNERRLCDRAGRGGHRRPRSACSGRLSLRF